MEIPPCLSWAARKDAAQAELKNLGIMSFDDFYAAAKKAIDSIEASGKEAASSIGPWSFDQASILISMGVIAYSPAGNPTGPDFFGRINSPLTGQERLMLSAVRQRATRLGLLN